MEVLFKFIFQWIYRLLGKEYPFLGVLLVGGVAVWIAWSLIRAIVNKVRGE
jgi:hypothetical protein